MTADATSRQQLLADLVGRRLGEVRPDLAGIPVPAADMVTQVPPSVLRPGDVQAVDRINKTFAAMGDADLGRAVRQVQRLLTRYVDGSDNPSAELLRHAASAFQAGTVGLLRGGSVMALRGIQEEHERFDRDLLLALNGEITVAKAEAQRFVDRQRADLADLADQTRESLIAERRRIEDTHEMALRGAEAAQQEATALRRDLEAARRDHADAARRKDAEIARLEALLRQERAATIERDRNHRNEVHQLRHDLNIARSTVGHLNAECERLEALLADATAPTPQESPMTTNPLLAAHSLAAFLIAQGHPARVTGHEVRLPGGAALPAELCQRWGAAYPTDTARLAHLRGVVRPLLGRAA